MKLILGQPGARTDWWGGGRFVNVKCFTPHQIQLRPVEALIIPKGVIFLFYFRRTRRRVLFNWRRVCVTALLLSTAV